MPTIKIKRYTGSSWEELQLATAPYSHNHPISEVVSLQSTLDGKVPKEQSLANGTDLDTVVESGFYRMGGSHTNIPSTFDGYYGQLIVSRGADTTAQILIDYNTDNMAFRGMSDGGGWTAWSTLYHDNNIPTPAEVGALGVSDKATDSDKLDGQDSTYYRNTENIYNPDYMINNIPAVTKSMFDMTRPDRTAFLPADQIIIETSTDAGATWQDAGVSDTDKMKLFTGQRPAIRIPLKGGVKSTDCMMRITITAMKYNDFGASGETDKYNYWNDVNVVSTERYCTFDEGWCWMYSNSDRMWFKVQKARGGSHNTWYDVREGWMNGWSGGNYFKLDGDVFGGSTTQTDNEWNWRFTFRTATPLYDFDDANLSSTATTSQQYIMHLKITGSKVWTSANNMMYHDRLYKWDENQNMELPASLSVTNGNANVYGRILAEDDNWDLLKLKRTNNGANVNITFEANDNVPMYLGMKSNKRLAWGSTANVEVDGNELLDTGGGQTVSDMTFTDLLTLNRQSDGDQLIRFDTERPWHFVSRGTGASNMLNLLSESNGKSFYIGQTAVGYEDIMQFYINGLNSYLDVKMGTLKEQGQRVYSPNNEQTSVGGNNIIVEGDGRLTDSRPASDVSAWAKAGTKPSYTASEVEAYAIEKTNGYAESETMTNCSSTWDYSGATTTSTTTYLLTSNGTYGITDTHLYFTYRKNGVIQNSNLEIENTGDPLGISSNNVLIDDGIYVNLSNGTEVGLGETIQLDVTISDKVNATQDYVDTEISNLSFLEDTDYATNTTGGTVKVRLSGTTLYIRNDGSDA